MCMLRRFEERQLQAEDGWHELQGEQCGEGDGAALHPPDHDLPRCPLLCGLPPGMHSQINMCVVCIELGQDPL